MLATVDVSAIASTFLPAATTGAPEQLHLSLTGSPSEMFVTFVLPNISAPCPDAAVALTGGASFPASHSTYTAGDIGWFGSIYTSRLAGLAPGARYEYTATACGVSAPAHSFSAAPVPGAAGADAARRKALPPRRAPFCCAPRRTLAGGRRR